MLRVFRYLIITAAFSLLFAACGDDSEDESSGDSSGMAESSGEEGLLEAAQEEGNVVFYSAYNEELSKEVAAAFTDKYGIGVDVIRQPSADLNSRFAAEADAGAGVADVLWQPDTVFAEEASQEGWLAVLDSSDIGNLDSVSADEQTDTYVSVLLQPWGIAYNTDLIDLDAAPTSWDDLITGDKIDGGLLVAEPGKSVATSAVYNFWLNEYGEEFFSELKRVQGYAIGDSVTNAVQQVGAGEVAAFVPSPVSTVLNAQETGAPVEIIVPDETTGFAMLASLASDADHPNAARLFVDFLLSEEGQAIVVADVAIPIVDNVNSGVSLPADYVPSDNGQTADRLDELADLLGT